MSSSDGSNGADFNGSRPPGDPPAQSLGALLFESLCYVLIEKGVLTKNDALSAVQTAAQVTRGQIEEGADGAADLLLLRRLFMSFEALDDRPSDVNFFAANVYPLRPPLHAERPEFPEDE